MRKILFILMLLLSFVLISCGGEDSTEQDNPVTPETEVNPPSKPEEIFYTVKFNNSQLEDVKVKAGEKLNQPKDASKENHIFAGWYLDSAYNKLAEFPLTINADTNLYAKFYSYQEAFVGARENTIGDAIIGYEYDYNITANVNVSALTLSGTTTGNAKYRKDGEVSYYDVHTNSGILFDDGSKHQIQKGTELQTLTFNQNGGLKKFESEQYTDKYNCSFTEFAHVLFDYNSEEIKSIKKTTDVNVYEIDTIRGKSGVVALLVNHINHPIVEKVIGELPLSDMNVKMFVTFKNGLISEYTYIVEVNVSSIKLNLEYNLKFKNVGKDTPISLDSYGDLALSPSVINNKKELVYGYLNQYMSQTNSGYDFVLKTGVDHGLKNMEINATFKGSAIRNVQNNQVYFHNDIEIDSDYKNKDLYKDAGLEDIHVKKTMLSNGKVYWIEKRLLDKTYEVENYTANELDSYYLFAAHKNVNNITFIQTKVKEDSTIYSIGIAKSDVVALLTWLNNSLEVDPLNNASVDVKVFGNFEQNTVVVDDVIFEIEVVNGKVVSINLECQGKMKTSFAGSAGFSSVADTSFSFSLEITPTSAGDSFVPFENVKDAK